MNVQCVCVRVQATLSGLPGNTPLVEAVEIDQEAGAPRTAMQIATDKYRNRIPIRQAVQYPEPKKRDQFLEFSVMPCTSHSWSCCNHNAEQSLDQFQFQTVHC